MQGHRLRSPTHYISSISRPPNYAAIIQNLTAVAKASEKFIWSKFLGKFEKIREGFLFYHKMGKLKQFSSALDLLMWKKQQGTNCPNSQRQQILSRRSQSIEKTWRTAKKATVKERRNIKIIPWHPWAGSRWRGSNRWPARRRSQFRSRRNLARSWRIPSPISSTEAQRTRRREGTLKAERKKEKGKKIPPFRTVITESPKSPSPPIRTKQSRRGRLRRTNSREKGRGENRIQRRSTFPTPSGN